MVASHVGEHDDLAEVLVRPVRLHLDDRQIEDPRAAGDVGGVQLADLDAVDALQAALDRRAQLALQLVDQLFGLDGSLKWKPLSGGEWRSLLVGGELFHSNLDDPALGNDPTGYYLWTQYQFTKNVYLGLRYDSSEELTDAAQHTDTIGSYLTCYTTEFLRFRFGLEHSSSDVPELDGLNTAELELNFVYGSHPVEPYWVNR